MLEWIQNFFETNKDNVIFDGLIVAFLTIVMGSIIDLVTTNATLQDALDTKSEWRQELFKVASKEKIKLEDVYTLRTTLRYTPKKRSKDLLCTNCSPKGKEYNFDNFTKTAINYCNRITNISLIEGTSIPCLSENNVQENVRIIARFLLKNHWEVLGVPKYRPLKRFLVQRSLRKDIKETISMIQQ
ncbi:hypothetical protein [Enterococcus sp. HY326]|uniref:hypothetical protein n=1 Tax=Enterococcus sp. HY326 TaxID=2971265 RepID=UPI00224063D6|nr:hypothetical protein [Enterococcus sp. HY326]